MKHLPVWYLSDINSILCDELIAECSALSYNDASMGELSNEKDTQYRNTSIQFLPSNHWMEKLLKDFGHDSTGKYAVCSSSTLGGQNP